MGTFCIYEVIIFLPIILALKALASLKQKIRKYNKDFESEIENYRQNPILSEDEDAAADLGTYVL